MVNTADIWSAEVVCSEGSEVTWKKHARVCVCVFKVQGLH